MNTDRTVTVDDLPLPEGTRVTVCGRPATVDMEGDLRDDAREWWPYWSQYGTRPMLLALVASGQVVRVPDLDALRAERDEALIKWRHHADPIVAERRLVAAVDALAEAEAQQP